MALMRPIDASVRSFLDENFARFGEAWGTLASLQEHFGVEVRSRWRKYELRLVTKSPPGFVYQLEVHKKHGGLHGRGPELPAGPELDARGRAQLDAALRQIGELWLIEPLNGELRCRETTAGIAALQEFGTPTTRRTERGALLMFRESTFDPWFVLVVDFSAPRLRGAHWIDLPPTREGRLLGVEEVEWIDRSFREHGGFGVYGSVSQGLREIVAHFEVRLQRRAPAAGYAVSVYPRDGHGHFLHFAIEPDGRIRGCAAGHSLPPPNARG